MYLTYTYYAERTYDHSATDRTELVLATVRPAHATTSLVARPEATPQPRHRPRPCRGPRHLGIIRLDELCQSASSLYPELVRALLAEQESDGGWHDPMTTALCLRALLCGRGGGLAIERGLAFLANLQKPQGLWPKAPIRRTPGGCLYLRLHPLPVGRPTSLPPTRPLQRRHYLVRRTTSPPLMPRPGSSGTAAPSAAPVLRPVEGPALS